MASQLGNRNTAGRQAESASRKKLLAAADRISGWLRLLLVALFVILVLSQIVMQNDAIRHAVNGVERWEGEVYP